MQQGAPAAADAWVRHKKRRTIQKGSKGGNPSELENHHSYYKNHHSYVNLHSYNTGKYILYIYIFIIADAMLKLCGKFGKSSTNVIFQFALVTWMATGAHLFQWGGG